MQPNPSTKPSIGPSILALSPDALMEHSGWMRHLVQRLVQENSQVDDVVQDAWAVALQNPPPEGLPLRAWLTGIVKRTALARSRTGRRRREREESRAYEAVHAGRDRAPSVAELSACADEQRFLLEAVGDLPDDLKAVLLLRFYSGLPPREIARELGIPVNTVRTRQRIGLERLRGRLGRRHGGDSSAWAMALLPLATGLPAAKAAALAAPVGTSSTAATWKLGSAVRGFATVSSVLAMAGLGWWALGPDRVPDLSRNTGGADALATVSDVLIKRSRTPARVAPASGSGAPTRETISAAPAFEAIAIDTSGAPIAGVGIDRGFRPQPNTSYGTARADWMPSWLTTDAAGRASAAAKSTDAVLYVDAVHPGYLQKAQVTELRAGEAVPIEMVRTATTQLEVEVVDPESGQSCATFHVLAFQYQDQFAKDVLLDSVLNETGSTSDGQISMTKRFAVDRPIHLHLMQLPGPWFGADGQSYRAEVDGVENGVTHVRFDVDLDRPETSGAYPVARGTVVDAESG
ncbi:MAG: RNA polymerase sigma factor, partial [Planctomycetota bacterium]